MTITACDRYIADDGRPRELVILDAAEGSRLLVDRRESDGGDARLLAHLAVDEPDENALLVCREFLAGSRRGARERGAQRLRRARRGRAIAARRARRFGRGS